MAKEPRPGMGQEEKDKLGQAAHEAYQKELALEAGAREQSTWTADEELEALDVEALRAEADRRGVPLPKSVSRDAAIARLTERRKDVEAYVRRREQAAATPPTGA